MGRSVVIVAGLFTVLAGCAGPTMSSAPSSSERTASDCVRNGGVWHANLDVCEAIRGPSS